MKTITLKNGKSIEIKIEKGIIFSLNTKFSVEKIQREYVLRTMFAS